MMVAFTGTRRGCTPVQLKSLEIVLMQEGGVRGELHHGDCVGADAQAHTIAVSHGWRVILHPPTEGRHRAFCHADQTLAAHPYLTRNRHIVDAADVLVACPSGPEEQRSGAWSTIRYARRSGKPVVICWPCGRITRENP